MRAEKKVIVEELSKQVGASPFVLMAEYRGLTVQQFSSLRRKLRAVQAECRVVKNTILRHAAKEAGLPSIDAALTGMTAVVMGGAKSDISAAAKILKQFTKEFEKPTVKLGVMGQQVLTPGQVAAVADLPSLDVMRSMLIGLIQSPATKLAVVLGAPAAQLARVLKARAEKEEAPAGEPAAA
ncbi:MAG: 50S ribosomal protein L10 [Verrucomicrobia bacterium]|nr:50S ribosomal protein L10 [Verrucomicrobiota bacterium]